MSLLKNFLKYGAEKTKNFAKGVIVGLRSNEVFASLKPEVEELEKFNNRLADSILDFNQSTKNTFDLMNLYKDDVINRLETLRTKAQDICAGDEALEQLTGYTPSKKVRSRRISIDPAALETVLPTGIASQLKITLKQTVPGNTGFEVHYILDGKDVIVGYAKIKGRNLSFLVSGFPSLKYVSVYLITLSTNDLRSTPSNSVVAAAS